MLESGLRMLAKVYPRVCGGTGATIPPSNRREGLSPRVRGNPLPGPCYPRAARSIPACAGEPAGVGGRAALGGVYPRVCGGTVMMPY